MFNSDVAIFRYVNVYGKKKLKFGLGKNVFTKFPQLGYSGRICQKKTTDAFMYDCTVSVTWIEEKKLMLCVQIIDRYLGNMTAVFGSLGLYHNA